MSDNKAVQRFSGYVLMAVGGLITVLCGGCTIVWLAAVIWSAIVSAIRGSFPVGGYLFLDGGGLIAVTTVVGVLPTAIGISIFRSGLAVKRNADASVRRVGDNSVPLEE